ncbi:OmpA family protein [Roseospira visakhapatnamensis]|uniref:Outer membrane protein OmpA-like peptidoglycan-associated protein n=1 Tax=Roseospira visakhapatnamensis TaxID=390880 RepID=A0A7W6RFN1_9PROT|nr:OmpA family protein [Roseospira visakhapatnamensis]MBB4267562.1 outer membrane protein OmpA-like peptidoglycan-associated protein [Roseospira visakhapatnamensis]
MRATRSTLCALFGAVLAALGMTGPPAAAQTPEGFYVGLNGGLNLNDSGDFDFRTLGGDLDVDPGFVGLGALGYAFGNGLRVELEGGYRQNGVTEWSGQDVDGTLSAWHTMANALYDFNLGARLSPYVGAGVGAAFVSPDIDVSGTPVSVDGTDVAFAYQAIAGIGYSVTDELALTMDYRFFHALDLEHDVNIGGTATHDNYMNHAITAGLRYAFGTPHTPKPLPLPDPAPAVVAAPPEVPTSYLVFFDFDSASLTNEAARIVDTAAGNAQRASKTRIEVTGHADRSGGARYNMVLSQRRAEAVMQRLVAQGIPMAQIAVFAQGESQPLIPTADGMREAQNRRVEIILL